MSAPLKGTLDVELTDTKVNLALRVGGQVVWQSSFATEAWHREVVDLVVAKTIKQKFVGLLAKGLGG